jgi:hypothetical protein
MSIERSKVGGCQSRAAALTAFITHTSIWIWESCNFGEQPPDDSCSHCAGVLEFAHFGGTAMSETTLDKVREQSAWYGNKARRNRRYFFVLKSLQIVTAAAIPIVSLSGQFLGEKWMTAILGALIGIIEGILQLGQFQQNWLLYRASREALRREDFLYSARAGPYLGIADPDGLYASRADTIMSGENLKWFSAQQQVELRQTSR